MNERGRGFSLVELAIVLVAASLLATSLLAPLSAQIDAQRTAETRRTLTEVRDALLGFAITNGRLPCPAKADATGAEAGGGAGACTSGGSGIAAGFVPAVGLGLSPSDGQGYLLDAWGERLRYAVSAGPAAAPGAFTDSNGMRSYWQVQGAPPPSGVQICTSAASIARAGAANAECAAASALTQTAVAVVYSTGRIRGDAARGPDAEANRDGDRVFVAHEPRGAAGEGGAFDDVLVWLAPAILYNRLVAAGRLP